MVGIQDQPSLCCSPKSWSSLASAALVEGCHLSVWQASASARHPDQPVFERVQRVSFRSHLVSAPLALDEVSDSLCLR